MNIVDWETHYLAFKDVGTTCGNMWYLPAIEELSLLTNKDTLDAVNSGLVSRRAKPIFASGCSEKTYWSSTETPEKDTVYTLSFEDNYFSFIVDDRPEWELTDKNDFMSIFGNRPKNSFAYVRTFATF